MLRSPSLPDFTALTAFTAFKAASSQPLRRASCHAIFSRPSAAIGAEAAPDSLALENMESCDVQVPVTFVRPDYSNGPSGVPSSLYVMALNQILLRGSVDEIRQALRWAPPTGGTCDPAFRGHVMCSLARRPDSPHTLIMAALQELGATPREALTREVAMASTHPDLWREVLRAQPGPHDEAFWTRAIKIIPHDVESHIATHPEIVDTALVSAITRSRRPQLLGPACAALRAHPEHGWPDGHGLLPIDHVLARAALTAKAGRVQRQGNWSDAPMNVRARLTHFQRAFQSLVSHGADGSASHSRIPARYGTGLERSVRHLVRTWSRLPAAQASHPERQQART